MQSAGLGVRAHMALAVVIAAWGSAGPARAQGYVFDNFNTGAVTNRPTRPTTFTLQSAATITQLITYHWNNGAGQAPGRIGLRSRGRTYGPYVAMGVASGPNQNVNWVAPVNVTVPPGTYTVIDTDRNTWSQNALSSGAGFVRVTGTAPTAACAPAGPARRGVPYGGNCRGCDHPDLTAYGGNGPFASGTNVSLHRPVSQPPAKFIASLSPTTAVSSYEQQCTAQGGTLTLVDDEPWYYYFIGFYARFACM